VRYVPDTTRRFRLRPHYETAELDGECEVIITTFLEELYGELILPIPTDALTKLIERDAADLDLYADLSADGPDVEGGNRFLFGSETERAYCKGALRTGVARAPPTHDADARIRACPIPWPALGV
jgi:hypothetical protein